MSWRFIAIVDSLHSEGGAPRTGLSRHSFGLSNYFFYAKLRPNCSFVALTCCYYEEKLCFVFLLDAGLFCEKTHDPQEKCFVVAGLESQY